MITVPPARSIFCLAASLNVGFDRQLLFQFASAKNLQAVNVPADEALVAKNLLVDVAASVKLAQIAEVDDGVRFLETQLLLKPRLGRRRISGI